jgi:hypothetical protein
MKNLRRTTSPCKTAATSDTTPTGAPEASVERLARQIETLGRIAEAGMEKARALGDRIASVPGDQPKAAIDISDDFIRVSREIRKTLELQHKLQKQLEDRASRRRAPAKPLPAPTIDPYFGERPSRH